jgi:putative glutamine amidotransferase
MQAKPLIGINCDFRPARKEIAPHAYCHAGYFDSVVLAGGVPILIPALTDKSHLQQILSKLDGLILTGGKDLDPKRLGLLQHPSAHVVSDRRENSDRTLCELALRKHVPLLGIGLGMQLINVLEGGTLCQHIPEDIPRAMPHFDPLGGFHRHTIEVVPESRIEKIYGDGEIRVNSYHHQSVQKVASGFEVTAVAPDGIVECIETTNEDWFCMGIQWHPESETSSALDMQIFQAFIDSCLGKTLVARRSSRKSSSARARRGSKTTEPSGLRLRHDGPAVVGRRKSRKLSRTTR